MKIKNTTMDVNDAVNFADYDKLLLKRRENNLLLSDYQINVLKNNGICYEKYRNVEELLFDIDEYLMNNYDDELDYVGLQIAELTYYKDTKK